MNKQEVAAVRAALAIKRAAYEWPRCGQGWPQTAEEKQAAALLEAAGDPETVPLTDEQAAAVADFGRRDGDLKAAANAAYDAMQKARRAWKSRRSDKAAFAAMKQAEALYAVADKAVKDNIKAFGRDMGV